MKLSSSSMLGRLLAPVLLAPLFVSCSDDPALVAQREQQRAEISKLQGELAILEEKMETAPPDRAAELSELKRTIDSQQEEVASLEKEIATLEATKDQLEKDQQAYRRKYVVQ